MDAFFRQHSGVAREQAAGEAVALPLDVPDDVRAALLGLPHLGDVTWRRVLRALRPPHHPLHLFAGIDAAGLAALRALLDFYCFPVAWVAWVELEQLVRAAAAAAAAVPVEQLPRFVADALAELRAVLVRVRIRWAHPTPAEVWAAVTARNGSDGGDNLAYAVALALGYRVPARSPEHAALPCRVLAAAGDVEGLQWARAARYPWSAVSAGALSFLVRPALEPRTPGADRCYGDFGMCVLAAAGGHLATLQWLHSRAADGAPPLDCDTCWAAAQCGHRDVLEWLLEVGCPVNHMTYLEAATSWEEDAALLRRLLRAGCAVNEHTIEVAAAQGLLLAIQVAREAGCAWHARACARAAGEGQLATLQWLRAAGCPWPRTAACNEAAWGGHLATLQWLVGQGCEVRDSTFSSAAASGDVATLQWLRAAGCPWIAATVCNPAAERGHLAAVQWLAGEGCALTARTCRVAAGGGHLATLQWLHAAGCPWDRDACWFAAHLGRLDILTWLVGAGCPLDARECFKEAVRQAHTDVVRWLLDAHRPPLDESMSREAAFGGLALLQLLVGAGCPWDKAACWDAAHRGWRPDTAAWVMAQIPWWQRGWTRFMRG